jgi:hypothetical protein
MGCGVVPVQLEHLKEKFGRDWRAGGGNRADVRQRAQVKVVSVQAFRPLAARPFDLRFLNARLDNSNHSLRDLILKLENLFQFVVELVGPEMRAALSFNKLRCDAQGGAPDLRTPPTRM